MTRRDVGLAVTTALEIIVGVGVALFLLFSGPAHAQTSGNDFCESPSVQKSSVAISITTSGSGEHQLIAAAANEVIQVCGFSYDLGGTTPTAEFDFGTQASTACDTGTTAMTGAMSATTRTLGGPLNYLTVPTGNALCIKLAGTSPTAVGFLTYVQK